MYRSDPCRASVESVNRHPAFLAATLAIVGIAMAPVPALLVTGPLAAEALFAFVLDLIKVPVVVHLGISQGAATSDSETKSKAPELQGFVR